MITFGDPKVFAIRLLPLKGAPPEADPAAAATWVSLELSVTGKNLTAHTHEDSAVFHPGVHWPAIYIARWLVHSWNGLFEVARWPIPTLERNARDVALLMDRTLANATDDDDTLLDLRDRFIEQHALQAAAAGAVLPGVYLARDGARVSIAWDSPPLGALVFHRSRGEADIPVGAFLQVVRNFVEWVADTISNIVGTPDHQSLVTWLQRLDSVEQARAVLLGYAGLDDALWYTLKPDPAITPEHFFELSPGWVTRGASADPTGSSIAVAFRCTSPQMSAEELGLIRDLIRSARPNSAAKAKLDAITNQVPDVIGDMLDYEQGYQLASYVRASLGNEHAYLDIESLLDGMGIPVQDIELSDTDLDGGVVCDDAHGPVIFVNRGSLKAMSPWGRRMVLAHELCHLLFDRQHAVPLAVISGPWAPAPIERRANAFAAEFLLPLAGISQLGISSADVTDEQIQLLKDTYKVGTTTCTWHLFNRLGRRA